ncbi:BglG family transcription antiterminator [Aerococcaceae bacterium WGS1372]
MALVGRWYNILNILESNSSISQKELEKILGTSRQTLRKNINLLNKELEKIAMVELIDKRYQLKVLDLPSYEKVLSGSLKVKSDFNSASKRAAYILKRFIEADGPVTIDDLTEELMVSRGTVANDISALRDLVQEYNVQIIGVTNKGLEIIGNEFNLRLLYINVVSDYFTVDRISETTKRDIIQKCIESSVPKRAISLLIKVVNTVIMRINDGNNLNQEIRYYDNFVRDSHLFDSLIMLVEIDCNVTLSNLEKDFICYPLNIYNQGNIEGKKYNFEVVDSLYEMMIGKIQELFLIKFDKAQLYEDIKKHIAHLINRSVMKVKSVDILMNEIESKYPISYSMANVAASVLSHLIDNPIPKVEVGYLALYFEMAISRSEEKSNKDIAVICHTGYGTAVLIKRQLQRALGDNVTVTTFSQSEVNKNVLNEYFAVFTTIPLRVEGLEVPIVQLSMIIDENYVREQWEKIERTQVVNRQEIEVVMSNLDNQISYIENLNLMISDLEENKLCDIEFGKRILEREELKSTVFDEGIAIPHAINKKNKNIIINIGRFNKPYNFNDKVIDVIFMIGIPELPTKVTETVLLEIYDFFFAVAGNEDVKQALFYAKDPNDIKKLFQKEVK